MNKAFITPSDLHNSLEAAITQKCAEADSGLRVSPLVENGPGLNAGDHTRGPLLLFGGNVLLSQWLYFHWEAPGVASFTHGHSWHRSAGTRQLS